jgi:hypothetical protein
VLAAPGVLVEEITWPEVQAAIAAGRNVAVVCAGSTEQNVSEPVVAGELVADVHAPLAGGPQQDAARPTHHRRTTVPRSRQRLQLRPLAFVQGGSFYV